MKKLHTKTASLRSRKKLIKQALRLIVLSKEDPIDQFQP